MMLRIRKFWFELMSIWKYLHSSCFGDIIQIFLLFFQSIDTILPNCHFEHQHGLNTTPNFHHQYAYNPTYPRIVELHPVANHCIFQTVCKNITNKLVVLHRQDELTLKKMVPHSFPPFPSSFQPLPRPTFFDKE
jgi:hypothetical protein